MTNAPDLEFEISLETVLQSGNRVRLRKLYQVIFISPKQKRIDTYICIVCGGKDGLKLGVTTKARVKSEQAKATKLPAQSESSISYTNILNDFRREEEPWIKYWGKNSKINDVTENDVQDRINTYVKLCKSRGKPSKVPVNAFEKCFLDSEGKAIPWGEASYIILTGDDEFDSDLSRSFSLCRPAITEPQAVAAIEKSQRLLHKYKISREPGKIQSPDYVDMIDWTHLKIRNCEWRQESGALPLKVRWNFLSRINELTGSDDGAPNTSVIFEIDDFKVYFVVGDGHDIDADDATISGVIQDKPKIDVNPFDRMARQPSSYFQKWKRDHDINSGKVYRLQGKPIRSIDSVPFQKLELDFKLTPSKFTYGQLVAAFALPFVAAIGLDSTRLDSAKNVLSDVCVGNACWFDGHFTSFPYQLGPHSLLGLAIFPSVAFMLATVLVSLLILVNAFGGAKIASWERSERDYRSRVRRKNVIGLISKLSYFSYFLWMMCIVLAADNIGWSVDAQDGYFTSSSPYLVGFLGVSRLFWVSTVVFASGALLWIASQSDLFPLWGIRGTMRPYIILGSVALSVFLAIVLVPELLYGFDWLSGLSFWSPEA